MRLFLLEIYLIFYLKSENLSTINFYTFAYECLEKLKLEKPHFEVSPIFDQLSKKYEQLKYSGSDLGHVEKPTKEESNAIIQELTKISRTWDPLFIYFFSRYSLSELN